MDTFLSVPALGECGDVDHGFGTRLAGSTATIARHMKLSDGQVVTVRQVHGKAVRIVEEANDTPHRNGFDAMITDHPGLLLAVATADCVPILIVDTKKKVVAAVHAGWRGSLKRIVIGVVQKMESRFGSVLEDLLAGLGPSAGVCCYEVGPSVLNLLMAEFPGYEIFHRETDQRRVFLDLRALNHHQLVEAGVPPDRINVVDECTICSPDRFSSYRREGQKAGRMWSGITVKGLSK